MANALVEREKGSPMSNDYPPPGSGQDPTGQSGQPPPPPPSEPQWNPQSAGYGQPGYGQQPYGQPPSYPPPPPGAPGGYGQPASNSGLAITSLALGIVGVILTCLCGVGVVLGIGAVITGWLAIKQIGASEGRKTGRGMAVAGIVTGALSILLLIVAVILVASGAIDSNFYLETS
jgi:hypothetical protein